MSSDVLLSTVMVELEYPRRGTFREMPISIELDSTELVDRCRVVSRQFVSLYCRPCSVNRYWLSLPLNLTVVLFKVAEDIGLSPNYFRSVSHLGLKSFLSRLPMN